MNNFYKMICESEMPYIIAEIGSNHNGDMNLAKELIVKAKKAGAHAVKFQSWSKDSIFSKEVYNRNYFLNDDYRNRKDYTLSEIVEKFSISQNELLEMMEFAKKIEIDCSSTPFSKSEVDFLVNEIEPKFIKIASMDINNYPFLEYVATKNLPIIISTGLSELEEIDKAVRTIENAGNKEIIILHCVSIYPPKDEDVNLKNIETLKKIYNYPVGFSDHTIGTSIPLAAIALGAKILEKHFTLDKNLFGWDHQVSANPEELEFICKECKRIIRSLGDNRIRSREDDERKNAFRRSIIINKDKRIGDKISFEDIEFKRPGEGIKPDEIKYVIGRKLKENVFADDMLKWEDLE